MIREYRVYNIGDDTVIDTLSTTDMVLIIQNMYGQGNWPGPMPSFEDIFRRYYNETTGLVEIQCYIEILPNPRYAPRYELGVPKRQNEFKLLNCEFRPNHALNSPRFKSTFLVYNDNKKLYAIFNFSNIKDCSEYLANVLFPTNPRLTPTNTNRMPSSMRTQAQGSVRF